MGTASFFGASEASAKKDTVDSGKLLQKKLFKFVQIVVHK